MNKPQKKSDDVRQFILENVEDHPGGITALAAGRFAITRQAAHKHVQKLVYDDLLIPHGATRDRTYDLKPLVDFSLELPLAGLEEDKVWRQHVRPLMDGLPVNVLGICQYGFTEMVNNALDHSGGTTLTIKVKRTYKFVELWIVDDGVGIFAKIQKELDLDDALHAILELSKGKLTTDPIHHTGEGVFFTSRTFDEFAMLSGKLCFTHLHDKDWLLGDTQELTKGTGIRLRISPKTERTTQQVFDLYTTDLDHSFSKTIIPVFLATYGDENLISRSQAKRLLARFEKFKEIVLDFSKVDTIGQAFADEIFRVFRAQNPAIHLVAMNASEQVQKMIARTMAETMP